MGRQTGNRHHNVSLRQYTSSFQNTHLCGLCAAEGDDRRRAALPRSLVFGGLCRPDILPALRAPAPDRRDRRGEGPPHQRGGAPDRACRASLQPPGPEAAPAPQTRLRASSAIAFLICCRSTGRPRRGGDSDCINFQYMLFVPHGSSRAQAWYEPDPGDPPPDCNGRCASAAPALARLEGRRRAPMASVHFVHLFSFSGIWMNVSRRIAGSRTQARGYLADMVSRSFSMRSRLSPG